MRDGSLSTIGVHKVYIRRQTPSKPINHYTAQYRLSSLTSSEPLNTDVSNRDISQSHMAYIGKIFELQLSRFLILFIC